MDAVIAAVKEEGVEEKDIRTQQFSLNPVYDWTEQGQVFRGFEASQSLMVKVRDLDKAGTVLGAATTAGANQAGDVQFTIDEPEALQAEARAKAVAQAREKAEELAKTLGMRIKRVAGYNEGGGYGAPMPMMRAAMADESQAANQKMEMTLPAGEQDVTVNVSISYELR
jgi:uncharacterized protein YggE